MTTFPTLGKDDLDAEQRAFWDEVTLGPRGFLAGGPDAKKLPDLYNAWLQFPEFGHLMLRIGGAIRGRPELCGKLREMVIINTSAMQDNRVEYEFHSPVARAEGLSDEVIAAIGAGTPPPFADDVERVVYQANVELVRTSNLAEATREAVVEAIGHRGLMQLVAVIGFYTLVSYTTNVADVQLAKDFSADEGELNQFFTQRGTAAE